MAVSTSALGGLQARAGSQIVAGLLNLAIVFTLVLGLWYVLLHPNGVMALYTPMYGFSLVVAFVAAVILIARIFECWPVFPLITGPLLRGILLTVLAVMLTVGMVFGFFWGFLGQYGIAYFSPHAIVAAGGTGAEMWNARENTSTAIVYLFAAFICVALAWTAGFRRWPWGGAGLGAVGLARLGVISLLTVIAYFVLFHPHVSYLFYPAQTMAGVEPWWAEWAMTSSALYILGLVLCITMWIVVTEELWDGWPWRLVDPGNQGNAARAGFLACGVFLLGVGTFILMLRGMDMVWYEPFEGGQYTDAPYFRYLHAGEIAGFVILSAYICKTYFSDMISAESGLLRSIAKTALSVIISGIIYVFYYSDLAVLLLGKVKGIAQPEDTPLAWTLLFLSVVLVQDAFFQGWPLKRGGRP